MVDKNIRTLRESLRAQAQQPPKKRFNGLDTLLFPINERCSRLEGYGLELRFFHFFRICRIRNKTQNSIYIPASLADQLVTIDGIPGLRAYTRPKLETPTQALSILYKGLMVRHLL